MSKFSILLLIVCSCFSVHSHAQLADTARQSNSCNTCCCCRFSQAPAGINTAHMHQKGEWMASYSYMNTLQSGARMGAQPVDDNTVHEHYSMSPRRMTMQMHMAMVMYGVTDRFTAMAMAGFMTSNMIMDMTAMHMPGMTMPAMTMYSSSSGITDTKLYGLYDLSAIGSQRHLFAVLGVNIPTGSITTTGTTMLGEDQRLPYNMQPGTGSYALLPVITWADAQGPFSFGAEASGDIKVNRNSLGYRWGNTYRTSAWTSRKLTSFMSASLRAEGVVAGKITGADPAISIPIVVNNDPTANTANYGGKSLSLYAGLNLNVAQPSLKRFSLVVEFGAPVYQDLNGIQMSLRGNLLAGLQYAF